MIDFIKELEKYDFMEVDEKFVDLENETVVMIQSLNGTLKRIAKEQSKTNMQVEEILCALDDEKEENSRIKALEMASKKLIQHSEEEKNALVNGLISILDQLEDLYRYSIVYDADNRANQMRLMWEGVLVSLMACGMMRIDEQNVLFNEQLNIAVQTKHIDELPSDYIIEVLRCGYIYNSVILRKAQVILNLNVKDGEHYE